ncbi:MAG: hypothetical protein M1829_002809 [Trizodia sp. TS-e1964]|nr:MAG: hypothetical protein M1829_002809 [Trizodia sp. TS-e1964]
MEDISTSELPPEPQTPPVNSLSLTEYATNPSPPQPAGRPSNKTVIPEEFLLKNGTPDYLRLILTSRVYEIINETPLTYATNLSNRLECKILLKREDLQPVFSFKVRGAYNRMAHLEGDARWRGVVACSAGNHAQGVAYSARRLKIPATIVMPLGTPSIKYLNVGRMGSHVILHGTDFDEAKEEAKRIGELHNLTNIAPFDDPYVIAGQGTIGMEILRQTNLNELKAVFCCVGGGGLIAGIGVYLKRLAPHIKVIGVETYDANAMVQSLQAKKRVVLKEVGLFADGAAVKQVGEETFRLCLEVVDEVIQVTTDETCAAIKDVFEDTRSIVEPAGALAVAGLKKYLSAHPCPNANRSFVAIASGANMNFERLRFIAGRAGLGEKREALLCVTIAEKPGAFANLVQQVLPLAVLEFSYRYATSSQAHVLMGISLGDSGPNKEGDLASLMRRLDREGVKALDVSDDELAKTHIRYLVGGRSGVKDECIFSFEFPERPNALGNFLTTLKPGFNISLFHYRNYGGDVGKVLAGIQCPESERPELTKFLRKLGYPFTECTDSPIFQQFMRE